MAWSTISNPVSGTPIATSTFGTLVAGNLAALGNASASYLTTWAGAGGNPTINNGTLTSTFRQDNKWVDGIFQVIWGSTTAAGSGLYSFTLPVAAARTELLFFGTIRDVSASKTFPIAGELITPSTTVVSLKQWNGSAGLEFSNVTSASPVALATGDIICVAFRYEAA